jgi:hypothetical protein
MEAEMCGRALANARGAALLLVITLVLLLAAIGAAVSVASRTEILIAASFRQGREAMYAAEGAVGRAVRDLAVLPDWNVVLSGAVRSPFTEGAATSSRVLPGGDTLTLCCGPLSLTDEVQHRALGGRRWGDDTPLWQMFAWGPVSAWSAGAAIDSRLYVVVWVADDPDDWDGDPTVDSNGILGIYAHALGPRGARGVVDALIRRAPAADEGPPPPRVRILSWREGQW